MKENYKSSQHILSNIYTEKKQKQLAAAKLEHLSMRLEISEPRQKQDLTYNEKTRKYHTSPVVKTNNQTHNHT